MEPDRDETTENAPVLGVRFEEALAYAAGLHRHQRRKGTAIPYIAHLLAVTALVLEDGGDEDEAIAALLHDTVEDQGGAPRLADIRARFGSRVAEIVAECTDADTDPKPPWRPRKEAYLEHLKVASPEALRVSAADKLHNARAILADVRQIGNPVFARFNAPKEDILWFYGALMDAFKARRVGPLAEELERVVLELRRLALT